MNNYWPIHDPVPNFFLLTVLTYTLHIFSCLFSTCTREWSKLVFKTTKGENNYHLCSWHQWPFRTSWSWFQKFIIKWELIQSIIYKRHQVKLAFEVFLKINIEENFQKNNSFCVIKKILCVTFLKLSSYAFIFHIKTHFL